MRPTDENQGAFTRPNLMSPSHRAGEDSILAKLERDPARRGGKPGRGRMAWYGAGLVVAAGLTATLVWLAADNGKPAPLLAQASRAPVPVPAQAPAPPLVTTVAPPHPSTAALIVDPPSDPPPLRLLEPAPKAAEPVRVPVHVPARVAAASSKPVAAAKAAPVRTQAMAKPEPRPGAAQAKAKQAAAKPAARPPARVARAPQPARQPEQVDSDVALISAVIVYGSGHPEARREEAPDACADDSCRSRPPRP